MFCSLNYFYPEWLRQKKSQVLEPTSRVYNSLLLFFIDSPSPFAPPTLYLLNCKHLKKKKKESYWKEINLLTQSS